MQFYETTKIEQKYYQVMENTNLFPYVLTINRIGYLSAAKTDNLFDFMKIKFIRNIIILFKINKKKSEK